jgi:hypothetical protein
MPVFSKPVCIEGTCWDLVHPWEPSCIRASIQFFFTVVVESFKVYSLFYGASAALQLKGPAAFLRESVPGILRSTAFLTTNGGLLLAFICTYRRLLGGFYYWTVLGGPAFICSALAIFVENKERRTPLAIYMLTLFTECLFNALKSKKWIKSIPYGEIAIFAIASALSMREYTINGKRTGLIGSFLRLLFTPKFPHFVTKHLPKEGTGGWMSRVAQITAWSFLVGYVLKVLSGMVGLISKGPKSWFKPEEIRQRLFGKWNFRLALFCACFSGGYKVVSKALEAVGVTGSMNATVAGVDTVTSHVHRCVCTVSAACLSFPLTNTCTHVHQVLLQVCPCSSIPVQH